MGELRVVADEKNPRFIKFVVETAVKSFKQKYEKKIEKLNSEQGEVKSSQEFIFSQYDNTIIFNC